MKKYEVSESTELKFIRKYIIGFIVGFAVGIMIMCVIMLVYNKSNDGSKEEHKGSYHDYNHAVIIVGIEGITIELDSYSYTFTDKYVLYTKDGKVYECPIDKVVFYNE